MDLIVFGLRRYRPLLHRFDWNSIKGDLQENREPDRVSSVLLSSDVILWLRVWNKNEFNSVKEAAHRFPTLATIIDSTCQEADESWEWINRLADKAVDSAIAAFSQGRFSVDIDLAEIAGFAKSAFDDPFSALRFMDHAIGARLEGRIEPYAIKTAYSQTLIQYLEGLTPRDIRVLFSSVLSTDFETISRRANIRPRSQVGKFLQNLQQDSLIFNLNQKQESFEIRSFLRPLKDIDFLHAVIKELRPILTTRGVISLNNFLNRNREEIEKTDDVAPKPPPEESSGLSFDYWQLLEKAGGLSEVERNLRTALEKNPENTDIHLKYADFLAATGGRNRSVKYYEKTLLLNPDHVRARINYARLLEHLGRFEDAEKQYRVSLDISANHPEVHSNLATLLSETGDHEQGEKHFKIALNLDPKQAKVHNNYANFLADIGRIEEAESEFKNALELEPDFPEVHYNLGTIYKETGNRKAAIDHTYWGGIQFILDGRPEIAPWTRLLRWAEEWGNGELVTKAFPFCIGLETLLEPEQAEHRRIHLLRRLSHKRYPAARVLLAAIEGDSWEPLDEESADITAKAINKLARMIRSKLHNS